MKKLAILTALVLSLGFVQAQRYGIVDTKYILEKIPDYKDAQKKLEQFSGQWQKEIDSKQRSQDNCLDYFHTNVFRLIIIIKWLRVIYKNHIRQIQQERLDIDIDLAGYHRNDAW